MKRTFLFLLTNLLMVVTLSVITSVVFAFLGQPMERFFGEYAHLILFAFVYGLGAALISLLISKPMAKFSTGAKTIDGSEGPAERWLVQTVEELAMRANIKTPEVAIYPGAPNAFATGAFKNSALVAVSDQIMGQMTKEELRAVLGHELSHVSNGDMVTLCLIQGVLNAFVIMLSRILAQVIASAVSKGKGNRRGSNGLYRILVPVLDLVLGILASLVVFWFSRKREYAADAGSARLIGTPQPMIAALRRLGNLRPGVLPDSIKAMGIAEDKRTSIWATHPSLEDRIAALNRWGSGAV